MWQVLSGISALLLLVSAIFAYQNNKSLKVERDLLASAEANVGKVKSRKSEAESGILLAENELKTINSERDLANKQLAEAQAELEELNATLTEKDATLADIEGEAKKAEDTLDLVGEIKVIQAKLTQYTNEIAEADAKEASLKNLLQSAVEQKINAERAIARAKQLVANQSSGRMPDISASVVSVDPVWGFAIIDAGSAQGLVRDAKVDVVRGGSVIGQATITQLESGRAVATIDKSSFSEGSGVQPGDRIRTSADSAAPKI